MDALLEKKITWIRENLLTFNLLCTLLLVLCAYILRGSTPRILKEVGKSFGSLAAIMGFLCLLYYFLREVFLKLDKTNKFSVALRTVIKKLIPLLRLMHPVIGLVMFYFLTAHIFSMLANGVRYNGSVFILGMFAAAFFVGMLILGFKMKSKPIYRKYHRFLSVCLVMAYLGHLFIRFTV